jgi:hypothetical protein
MDLSSQRTCVAVKPSLLRSLPFIMKINLEAKRYVVDAELQPEKRSWGESDQLAETRRRPLLFHMSYYFSSLVTYIMKITSRFLSHHVNVLYLPSNLGSAIYL